MFSVIIPTHNRRQQLLRTLESLAAQEGIDSGFEVVVVVDGSTDASADAVRARDWPFLLELVEQSCLGQANARNRGAERARGEVLIFLDDDMVLASDFLAELQRAFVPGVDGVLTTVKLGGWAERTLLSDEAAAWDEEIACVLAEGRVRFDDIRFCAHAVRRKWFERLGGFDEGFTQGGMYGNEDIELGHRMLEAGAVFRYHASAVAETHAIQDPYLLLRRAHQTGINDVRLVHKHPVLAGEVFGRKLRLSRIHRALAPPVLAVPRIAWLFFPIRYGVVYLIERGVRGWLLYRLWFATRAVEYWRGVETAGGRALVREVRVPVHARIAAD